VRFLFVKPVATTLMAGLILSACGGGGGSGSSSSSAGLGGPTGGGTPAPAPAATKFSTELETREEAARFLIQAGFGGTDADIDALVGTDAANWMTAQMRAPVTKTYDAMLAAYPTRFDTDREHSKMLWTNLLTADDVLRQRMMFALSQIFVISDNDFFDEGYTTAQYTDILTDHAFGNYREMIEDITYSPAMGQYLTYYRNRKGDERSGRMPDENYARELLQLFSIGLVELNQDGTPKTGSPETYDNDDIIGLAKVFTGLSGSGPSFRWSDQDEDWRRKPLQMFDDEHSPLEKTFLGTTIPADTPGVNSIDMALDAIADHPNVAPFLSRQMIQRFTSSSPSPEYVRRVADAFDAGSFTAPNGRVFGSGQKGDFAAMIAAILLDESVHDDVQEANEGKLREPIVKFTHYARAFDLADIDVSAEWRFNDTSNPNDKLGQHPLRSPSVFNFYRPGYLSPATESGEAGLTAPEFQIVNEGSVLGFSNFMTHYITVRADDPAGNPGFNPDFAAEIALANDPQALIDHLDVKLTAGQLSDATKAEMVDTVSTLLIAADDAETDRLDRVQLALIMMMSSGAFAVQN